MQEGTKQQEQMAKIKEYEAGIEQVRRKRRRKFYLSLCK